MKVGLNFFPVRPAFFFPMARRMDELGYDTVWMGEHLVFPTKIESPYPYDTSLGAPLPDTPLHDPLITLAAVAAQTRRIHVGTSVYILTLRHPLVAARLAATLDSVSEGRFRFGVGSGWLKEEFAASDQPWEHRGARLEEAVDVMRRLWSEDRVVHEGRFYRFAEVGFQPKPGKPIPLILGGETEPALRRAARIGDGWTGVDHTPQSAAERVRQLGELRGDRPRLDISVDITALPDRDTLLRFHEAGVDRLIMRNRLFSAADRSLQGALDNLSRFAETAMYPAREAAEGRTADV
jgi:probable F420-dependent oxidoreductase